METVTRLHVTNENKINYLVPINDSSTVRRVTGGLQVRGEEGMIVLTPPPPLLSLPHIVYTVRFSNINVRREYGSQLALCRDRLLHIRLQRTTLKTVSRIPLLTGQRCIEKGKAQESGPTLRLLYVFHLVGTTVVRHCPDSHLRRKTIMVPFYYVHQIPGLYSVYR